MDAAVRFPRPTGIRMQHDLAAVAAGLWWFGKHLLALAMIAVLLAGCALPPKENLWRATRVVELVDADAAGKAGKCGAVPSARVGYYLGGTRVYATVPLGALPDVQVGQTAYFKADSKCSGLQPLPPKDAWLR